jgi:hypothetical protein
LERLAFHLCGDLLLLRLSGSHVSVANELVRGQLGVPVGSRCTVLGLRHDRDAFRARHSKRLRKESGQHGSDRDPPRKAGVQG